MSRKTDDACRDKAKPDEPLFTLRAQDQFAPVLVRLWADMVRLANGGANNTKTDTAYECANEMESWGRRNGTKVPD